MKKLIVITLGILMIVSGCGDSGGETTTCTVEHSNGILKSSFVFTMKDDEVVKMFEVHEANLSDESDENIKMFEEEQDIQVEDYKKDEEIDFEYEEKDKVYTTTITFNVKDFSAEHFLTEKLLDEDGKFSAESVKTELENNGHTCSIK